MQVKIVVHSQNDDYEFLFHVHESVAPEDRQIEASFYGGNQPEGIHHEIEIIYPDREAIKSKRYRHCHLSEKNQKMFVCWTGHLPKFSHVELLLPIWCQGNVYSVETGEDFGALPAKHHIDFMDFSAMYDVFNEQYGISVVS